MLNAYLNFDGSTEEAFNFYKEKLGGEFTSFQRFGETPHGAELSEEDKNKLMHIPLETSKGTIMGSDHLESMGFSLVIGNNFSLSIQADSEEEADRLFNGLAESGKIDMPIQKAPWNAYFGMLTDKFGIRWMINHQYQA